MFAKYKPIYNTNLLANKDQDPLFYRGMRNNCGIIVPKLNSIWDANRTNWELDPLLEGDWKRITDFDGYYHSAKPFLAFGRKDIEVNIKMLPGEIHIVSEAGDGSYLSLSETDFANTDIGNLYVTACVKTGGDFIVQSATWQLGSSHGQGTLLSIYWSDLGLTAIGKYAIYMVLSTKRYINATRISDIRDGSIYATWYNSEFRNPFYLNIVDKELIIIKINRLGTSRNYDQSIPIEYFEIDYDKIMKGSDGYPLYSASNVLESASYCFMEVKIENNSSINISQVLSALRIQSTNFNYIKTGDGPNPNDRYEKCPKKEFTAYNDKAMLNTITHIEVDSGETKYFYLIERLFDQRYGGDFFIPNDYAVIAPCQVDFFYSGGDLVFPTTEFVVRNKP